MGAGAVACKKYKPNMNIWLGIHVWRAVCLTLIRANVQIIGAVRSWCLNV